MIEGEVELRLSGGRVLTLGPDDSFGEMALVDASPRSATAVAVSETTLAVIDRTEVPLLGGRDPKVRPPGHVEPGRAASYRDRPLT